MLTINVWQKLMCRVCCDCVCEEYLRQQIAQSGEVEQCEFCASDENPTIALEELAERVHSVLAEYYYMTSPDPEGFGYLAAKEGYWEQPGELVTYAIMNLIDSSEELGEKIRKHLSCQYDPEGKDALIDPCPYASDSQYEVRAIDTYEFQESWTSFRHEILSRSRFFNQTARSALEHLFSGIDKLVTHGGEPVVRVLSMEDSVFRARVAKNTEELDGILKGAPSSLGAPHSRHASPGRMNAEGISVFYGATDANTCIAEIRAPVGSSVVIGRFSPLRELRLLDLTRLKSVFVKGSLFDPVHTESLLRVDFLKRLVEELSQPVMPGAESRDYLPTQVVAEYLGSHPDMALDGVMFASSQAPNMENTDMDATEEQQVGKNVVLFSHACRLEHYALPAGTKVEVHRGWMDPNDPDCSITVWEHVPNDARQEVASYKPAPLDWLENIPRTKVVGEELVEEQIEASILLDMNSIEILRIEGVSYQTASIYVSRYRSESVEPPF